MENYTYLIKPAHEMSQEELRRTLIAIEEDYTDEGLTSLIQMKPEQKAAKLITPNKEFVQALLNDKRFVMTEQIEN